MFSEIMLILGMCCGALARDCLNPAALNDFAKKNFEGDWYSLAFSTPNKTEESYYKNTKCSLNTFKLENDNMFSGVVDYLLGDVRVHYTGEYTIEDPSKAKMSVKLAGFPLTFAYDVVCTDYSNWAVIYTCSQIEAGHSSEFIGFLGRDRTKYSELIANAEAAKCVQDHLQVSITSLRETPQDGCTNH